VKKGIVFDQDGTLYPFVPEQDRAWRELTVAFIGEQFHLDPEGAAAWMLSAKQEHKSLTAALIKAGKEVYERYEKAVYTQPRLDPALYHRPNPALAAKLAELRAGGFRLGVLSTSPNGDSRFVDRTLEALGISEYFDCVVGATDADAPKPDAAHFLKIAHAMGVEPSALIVVGDEHEKDIVPALRLGMRAILVIKNGRRTEEEAAKLSALSAARLRVIDNLDEIGLEMSDKLIQHAELLPKRIGSPLLNRYRICSKDPAKIEGDAEPLGRGGMGLVYRVEQILIPADAGKEVTIERALKILDPLPDVVIAREKQDLTSGRADFQSEVRNLASISHQNLVSITDAGRTLMDGHMRDYLVLEYVEGETLEKLIEDAAFKKRLTEEPDLVLDIAAQITAAMQYLHEHDTYHRDLMPKNVFVQGGERRPLRVRVGDLGLGVQVPRDQPELEMFIAGTKEVIPESLLDRRKQFAVVKWPAEAFLKSDLTGARLTFEALVKAAPSDERPVRALRLITRAMSGNRLNRFADVARAIARGRSEYLMVAGVRELPSSRAVQKKIVRLPGGSVALTERTDKVVHHRSFQRLRRVPQVQLAGVRWPGAVHTRYEHSLGCLRNMQVALTHLMANDYFSIFFSERDCERALVAALLSSIHCFPMYHIVCELRRYGIAPEELRTDNIVRRVLNDGGADSLGVLISREFDGLDVEMLCRLLSPVAETDDTNFADTAIRFLLDSSIDVRVPDYVRRDSLHSGIPAGAAIDVDHIYEHLTVQDANGDREVARIVLDVHAVPAVEQLVQAKFWMYEHVYWSMHNRAAIVMLMRLLYELHRHVDFTDLVSQLEGVSLEDIPRKLAERAREFFIDGDTIASCFGADDTLRYYEERMIRPWKDIRGAFGENPYLELQNVGNRLAETLKLKRLEVLVDLPPGARNFGQELTFVDRASRYMPSGEASALIEGIHASAEGRLRSLRVFIHPDRSADISREKVERLFEDIVNNR